MKEEVFFQAEYEDPWVGTVKRKIVYKNHEYVLTALKYAKLKSCNQDFQIDFSVGYLIDKKGNITRNLSEAFVFECSSMVDIHEYQDKPNLSFKSDIRETEPQMKFYKNGLFITAMLLSNAQKWLNDHPLPRKGVSKMTRLNVFAKYNGKCAYCGCDIKLEEMQVDHFVAHMGEGGEDTLDNYYPSCSVCNRVKSNNSLKDFKEKIRHCGEIHRNRKKPLMADSDKIAIKYDLTKEDHEITFFFENYNPSINVEKIKELL